MSQGAGDRRPTREKRRPPGALRRRARRDGGDQRRRRRSRRGLHGPSPGSRTAWRGPGDPPHARLRPGGQGDRAPVRGGGLRRDLRQPALPRRPRRGSGRRRGRVAGQRRRAGRPVRRRRGGCGAVAAGPAHVQRPRGDDRLLLRRPAGRAVGDRAGRAGRDRLLRRVRDRRAARGLPHPGAADRRPPRRPPRAVAGPVRQRRPQPVAGAGRRARQAARRARQGPRVPPLRRRGPRLLLRGPARLPGGRRARRLAADPHVPRDPPRRRAKG